jgi:hypothetical protein
MARRKHLARRYNYSVRAAVAVMSDLIEAAMRAEIARLQLSVRTVAFHWANPRRALWTADRGARPGRNAAANVH